MKKLISTAAALSMALSIVTPAAAAEYAPGTTHAQTEIKADIGSTYVVVIPQELSIREIEDLTYDVKVLGDVIPNDTISITPDATVTLSKDGANDSVSIPISQPQTDFQGADITSDPDTTPTATGTLQLADSDLSAGQWSGTLNFTIAYQADQTASWDTNPMTASEASAAGYTYNGTDEITITGYSKPSSVYDITLPSSIDGIRVTTIGEQAFTSSTITSVTLPDSITTVGLCAFMSCAALTNAELSASMTNIPKAMFSGCSLLSDVLIPNSITSIGENAFDQTKGLKTINLPNQLQTIGPFAFRNSGLTTLTTPFSLKNIGGNAFQSSALKSVTVNGTECALEGAFGLCEQLTSATLTGVTTAKNTFDRCSKLTDVTFSDDLITMEGTFFSCTSLVSITLPSSVEVMDANVFKSCSALKTINICKLQNTLTGSPWGAPSSPTINWNYTK